MLEIRVNPLNPFHPCSHPAPRHALRESGAKHQFLQVIFSVALNRISNSQRLADFTINSKGASENPSTCTSLFNI